MWLSAWSTTLPSSLQAEAVNLVAEGRAPCMPQWEGGASYDQIWQKKDVAEISWNQPALVLHNFIRGNDKVWCGD